MVVRRSGENILDWVGQTSVPLTLNESLCGGRRAEGSTQGHPRPCPENGFSLRVKERAVDGKSRDKVEQSTRAFDRDRKRAQSDQKRRVAMTIPVQHDEVAVDDHLHDLPTAMSTLARHWKWRWAACLPTSSPIASRTSTSYLPTRWLAVANPPRSGTVSRSHTVSRYHTRMLGFILSTACQKWTPLRERPSLRRLIPLTGKRQASPHAYR
jgi:hypothetical protein